MAAEAERCEVCGRGKAERKYSYGTETSHGKVKLAYVRVCGPCHAELSGGRATKPQTPRDCEVCGKTFKAPGPKRFCSNRCRSRAYRASARGGEPEYA